MLWFDLCLRQNILNHYMSIPVIKLRQTFSICTSNVENMQILADCPDQYPQNFV